ncbi:DUF5801 repeats-in-toxin domain-containing protein [Neorhizobium galegae]|uniref:Dystroglycan-type cadherin-like domain-containing protein n=2 Tax=Neorhizobium galegae TaxID=399 RepID=A0A068STS5_NEOGA|nr:DUF5801 repeats-in-toxin domain-containing protein [Neorhizobium galegae]CDN49613.1 Hypothetical protein RG540_CH34490 [Neorhizobium galegae bv. orientalis str. HAMBI 540]
MSVEDPRLSSISEENLTENFSSEIQEEIASSSTPSPIEHEIQVAQAGDGRTPTTGRVPTDPNAPVAPPAAPAAEVTPDANNIVHLAANVAIDDVRIDGANLILVQADGTEVVILNGAAKIPTMLIGEVEVPQQVLFAALEDSGINVAAGPDGSYSASGRPDSSGAQFEDSIQGNQNGPIQLASLLGDTDFGGDGGLDAQTGADDQPDAFDMGSPFIFSESVLADDVIGNETINGTLGFDGGDDFGIVSSVNYQSTFDMAEGTGAGAATALTSGGHAVTVSTSADGLTVTGTITVGETTVTVFTLTVTDPVTGAFTYTQSQPLDHPDLGQIGADDALRLNFTFTVTDKDGDSDTGSFSIEIGDDGPVQREAVGASLNEDDVSAYPATDGSEAAKKTGDISLGISWGADADTRNGEGDTFGRSVGFANAAGAVPANAEGVYTGASDVGLSVTGGTLTSGGSELYYVITDLGNGGQTLTAYVDGSEPAAKVFEISLDPTSANGSYTVEIFQELDHTVDSDALTISFQFQGVDADGDAAASGTALITIADDAPVIGAAGEGGEGKVDEGGSNTAQGSLGISWGADDGNTSEDGGYDGTQDAGDRSVVFTPGEVSDLPPADGDDMPALKVGNSALSTAAVSAFMQVWSGETEIGLGNLTSGGQPLVYTLSPDGTVLTAADQEGGPVFTVTLSDTGAGGYTFELQGVLDHPGHGETGSKADILTFEFTYTVRDGDGDVAESTFTVDVKDDVPVATGNAVDITSDEGDIVTWSSLGSSPSDGAGDGSTTGPNDSLVGPATVSGSIASVVAFGADGAAAGGGFGFVADATAKMQALALTSKGGTLSYAMIGDALVAYVNGGGGAGLDSLADRPVFSLALDHTTGAFTYQQYDQLDHVTGNGENTALKSGSGSIAAIDFGAVIQATDGDGDQIGLGGKFSITITDDVPAPSIIATGASTTIDETVNNQSNDTGNQAVRSLFAAVANVGHDADMGNAAIFARNGDALVSTFFSAPGADETTTKVLSLEIASAGLDSGLATTGGKAIFLFEEGGLIVGRFDSDGNGTPDTAAFAVAIDQSGRVSVAQYVSLHQGNTATFNETVNLGDKISAVVTATDYDGDVVRDTVSIGSHIRFADDGPLASGAKVSATADEDDISNLLSSGTHPNDGTADGSTSDFSWTGVGNAATVSGSIASVVAFGADGAAAGGGFGFVADAAAKMQALALTSKGGTLSYAMIGDALVAYVNVVGGIDRPVFSLTLDHATGAFTYQQYDQLDHVAGNGENTALKSGSGSIAAIDFGAVIQATDGDGDHVGLGGKFSITITDDVPEIAIVANKTVTIDETSGFQNDDIGAGSVGSLFAGVGNRGVDADLGGPIYARDDVIDISVKDGADDNLSTALTLRIDGGNGIDSGLLTTGGANIYLYLEGEVVVGRVGGADGLAAFAIAIDSDGRVSVAEYLSLQHPNNASSDEGVNLSGKISAVLTATDYDGDVVTKSVSIGDKITFEDDGPSVGANSGVWVDDDNVVGAQGNNGGEGDHALANTTGVLSHDFGADGGSIAWKTAGAPSGFTYVHDGNALLVMQGTTTVMTVTLDTATGAYTVTQNAAIDHPMGNDENEVSFNLTYTVTDGDGDHVDGTLTINADDDTPVSTGVIGTGAITESAVGGSIAGELSALVSPGADGIGRYSVETTGLSSSLTSLTSGGVALTYSVVGNALVAKAGTATIFTFSVDPATGHYTFTQTGPLDHTDSVVIDGVSIPAATLDAAGSHAAVADVGGNDLAFVGHMTDGDAIIRVSNSGNTAVTWTLDNNNPGGTDYVLNIPAHTTWYLNVGNVPNQTKFDLDGVGSPNGSTTVNNGHSITFTDGDGSLALDLSSAVTVTDGDGDSVALHDQLIVTVTDSVPTAGPNTIGTVEEGGTETITAALTGLSWGADAGSARTLSFTGSVATKDQNGASVTTLSSNGNPVTIAVIGGVLTGFTGSANPPALDHIVFTALLNAATGGYTFSLLQPLDHTAPNATSQYLDLALGFTATDADGDAATSTVTVRVDAAGSIDSINYSSLSTSVFVNLDGAAHMVGGQTVAADTATDGATVIDKVIGIDSVSGIVDALGGAGNDVLIGGDEANKLTGNGGNDYLDGGLGADVLDGGEGNDTFVLGADVTGSGTRNIQLGDGSLLAVNIAGLAGTADKVIGGAGNDTIILERDGKSGFVADYSTAPGYLSGVEKIVGTDGNDVILLAAGSTADGGPITIEGGDGNDILGGSNSADIINGGDGNDLISGLGGNDTLTGGNGDDVIWGGLGADTIHGGAGSDTIDLTADLTYAAGTLHTVPVVGLTTVGVDISGKAGTLDLINGGFDLADTIYLKAGSTGFVLDGYQTNIEGVERIVGTDGDDVIVMRSDYVTDDGAGRTTIEGGLGNDTIVGGAGNDFLDGAQGADTLAGGDGADILKGGADNDALWGGKASDNLYGNGTTNQGSDLTATIGEADSANYGGPADKYHVFFNANAFNSGLGIWQVEALGGAPELMDGGPGSNTDNLYGIELIKFSNGIVLDLTDPVRVFDGANLVGTYDTIQAANDAASTLAGFRIELVGTIVGETATITKESLTVVGGVDDTGITLTLDGVQNLTLGGAAPINVAGNGLNNGVQGNDGENVITSGKGSDALNGGAGNDKFILSADIDDAGSQGSRTVTLGDGSTRQVSLNQLSGEGDTLTGGTGIDRVELVAAAGAKGFVFDRANYPGNLSGAEEFIGTDGDDVILLPKSYTSGDISELLIDGGKGNDVLQGSDSQADRILGGDGNDLISGLGGNDILEGGAGSDEIWGGAGNDQINGGSGIDNITGGLGDDTIDGGIGGDTFNYAIGDGVDTIDGGTQGDVLLTSGNATAESAVLTVTSTGFTLDVDGDGIVDVNATNIESVVLYQADGADKITVRGQDSAETITIEGNSNLLQVYGNGIPSVSGISTSELTIEGKGGNDVINASNLNTVALPPVALTLDGGAGNDTITGSAGADTILGGAGNDTILYKVGAGADIIDGGSETGLSNPDYDVLKIAGDAVQRSFNIAKATGGSDIVAGVNATDILVSYTGANGATVRADEIERIEVTLGSAGDSIAVGDLSGTAIAPTTVVINGGVGSDTIDLTGLVGTKVEINDVDGAGPDTDTVKLAGKWADYTITEFDGTFTFSQGGHVVATAKNIEQFTFQGENGGPVQAADLLNDAPHAGADSNAGDPVVEAGGVSNGTLGDPSAIGNVLTNDTDADVFDSKQVVAIQFGSGPATAVPAGNGDVTIAGTYGTLTIHSDGSYAYALDNNDGDTQALAQDAAASDVFTYTMADAHGLTSNANLTINITGTNDAPVLNGTIADQVIAEDNALSFTVPGGTFSDVDSPSLTYTATLADGTSALPGWLHFDAATMTFSGTPDLNWNGAIDVKVTASDGSLSVSDTFTLTVTPVNDAPIVTNDVYVTDEDTALSGLKLFANDSDVEGSPLTANGIAVGSQLGGSISFEQNGTLRFEPLANESGYAVLQYGVSDGNLSSTGTVTIDVRPVADAATISGSGSGSEDATAALSLNIAVGDTDGSEKVTRVELSGFPAGATFNQGSLEGAVWVVTNAAGVNTSGLTMTPPTNYAGDFTLNVKATVIDSATLSDGHVYTNTKDSNGSIGVSITPVNDGHPTVAITDSTPATDPTVGDVLHATLGSDPDGTPTNVVYTWLRDGNAFGATGADYTLTAADTGHKLSVKTTYVDGQNFSETVTSTESATVISNNHAPVAAADRIYTNAQNEEIEFKHSWLLSNDTDADGNSLSINSFTWSSNGPVKVINAGAFDNGDTQISVTLGQGNSGTFSYGITDGSAGSGATVTVQRTANLAITGSSQSDILIDTFSNGTSTVTLDGGAGSDYIIGGSRNNVIIGDQSDYLIDGGTGSNDTIQVSSSFTSASDAQIVNIDAFTLTGAATLNISNQSEGFVIKGSAFADTITGGGGNDTITGGAGGDTLTGGAGSDTFVIAAGDSTPQIGGSFNDGTITGYDVITDWASGDKLDFSVAVKQAYLFGNGVDSTLAIGGDTVELHTVNYQTGIATFYGTDGGDYQTYPSLSINSTQALAAITQYLTRTVIGEAGATLAFNAMGNAYVYQQTGNGAGGTLVELTGVTLTDIYTTPFTPNGVVSSIDPIILDLDHNGFTFSSVEDGVKFDIDADGHKDQVAWTKTDGILAYDVDGNGKIDNGSEIFTPNFGGGTHAGGVAALSTLDVNHDGKIDASDTGFDKLLVWQDANGNGISDEGELKGLHDYGITGISLDAHGAEGYIDGQSLFAEGSFTYADGSTGSFVEVGFDTLFSDAPDHVLVGTDGDDILAAMPGLTQMTGGAGADTFVLDPSALHELDMADIITDYKSNEGDAVDVSKLLDTLLGHQATGEEAAANVRTTIAGNDTTVSVQVATDSWKDVAVLQNHTEAVKILFDDEKHAANISHV